MMRSLMFVVAVGLLVLLPGLANAQLLEKATELLTAGRAKEAYQLLQKEESAFAGQVAFDYLLGRAALDAGESGKASMILERVLMVEPNHAGARLDMGRAYFVMGDRQRAKEEFEALLVLNPPGLAKTIIDQYLAAIENKPSAVKTRVTSYAEASFGHDSNVTVGPTRNTILLPVFGLNFTLSGDAQAKSDNFHQVTVGSDLTHYYNDQDAIMLGASFKYRNYNKVNAYDQPNGEAHGGFLWNRGSDAYRVLLSFDDLRLAHDRYREVTSLTGDWRHQLSQQGQISLMAQSSAIRYVQRSMRSSDYNQYLLSAGWNWQSSTSGGFGLSTSVFTGMEQALRRRTDGDKLFVGLRAGATYVLMPEVDVFASGSWQYGKYKRFNILYQEKRLDKQLDIVLGASWRPAPGWSVRPQVAWTRNESNTTINEYVRTEASVAVRKDF